MNAIKKTKLGFREYHRRLANCRLCRMVAISILAAILVIETIILIPSYNDRKRDILELMATEAVTSLSLTKSLIDSTMIEESRSLWQASIDRTPLQGLYYAGPDNMEVKFGDLPAADNIAAYRSGGVFKKTIYRNGDDFDVLIPKTRSGFDYDILIRLDGTIVHAEMKDFVWNVAGLVVIVSLFVTISSMMIVGYGVLQPLIGLREAFVKAGGDPDHPEKYLIESNRQDEIGDLFASFNRMLLRTGQVLDELHRSQQAMEQTNIRLEDEVDSRTKSLKESHQQLKQEMLERHEAEERARELARMPAENPNPVMRILDDGCLRYANAPCAPILKFWGIELGDTLPDFWKTAALTCLESKTSAHYELVAGQNNFELDFLPVPETNVINVYGRDVSAVRQANERLEHLARHDTLTGLPNRAYYLSHLDGLEYGEASLDDDKDHVPDWALYLLDIDHFMTINDSLGPDLGDQLLSAVADRLRNHIDGFFLARTDGDAFALVASGFRDAFGVTRLARELVELAAEPFTIDDRKIELGLSIGIALSPFDAASATDMMNAAELALKRAKAEGRNTFRMFDSELGARTRDKRLLEKDLRHAIERNELELHYQPKFDMNSLAVTSAEALLRWKNSKRGFVSPGVFIPIAEESGLIDEIGDWVLSRAMLDFTAINIERQAQGQRPLPVAINLSARQLQPQTLAARVQELMDKTGINREWVELEITESMLMADIEEAVCVLQELADLGVKLSIDDFGTGYSSLNYLRRLPVHKMKVDRSFVIDVENDPSAEAVARSVMGLANALCLKTVAEGIETEEQLCMLRDMNCDEGQGWLISKALPLQDFKDFAAASHQEKEALPA